MKNPVNMASNKLTTLAWSVRCAFLPPLLAAFVGMGVSVQAVANPANPVVARGQVSFSQQANVFTITNSPSSIINWSSFSISADEMTRFIQQSASSSVLNRITGQDPSRILGALQSNGRVYLINPNGIMFGAGSQVNVAGLVASTLAMSDNDFLAGKNNFLAGNVAGAVSNAGSITTPSGGQVYLIAPNVTNSGIITSPKGDVVLAAGHSVQLVDSANPDLHVVVSAPGDQVVNLGQVIAQGGSVGIYGALINQRGTVNANSAQVGDGGKIVFKASGDTLLEAGSVTTATGSGQGGQVSVLGQRVALTGDARIDASGQTGGGTVLVGGDYQGKNAAVQNADQTVVGADASIKADAIASGDGGKIVVWADGATSMAGSLSARGGAASGNGGIAETSGKQYLDFRGTVDLRAPRGKQGNLLLDPNNLTIATGSDTYVGQNGGNPFEFEAYSTPAVLTPLTITNQLALSDVSVFTNTGSITVLSPVNWSNSSELTLSAATGIAVNAQMSNIGGGKLSLYTMGGNITQTAAISVPTLAAIANSGVVLLTNNSNNVGTLAGSGAIGFSFHEDNALTIGTVSGGVIPTQSGISSSAGDINIISGIGLVFGGLAIDAPLTAPSGTLNLRSFMGDITQTSAISAPLASIIADDGSITLNNTSNNVGTLVGYSAGSSGFSFVNSGSLTVDTVAGNHGLVTFNGGPLSLTALNGDLTISDSTYGVQTVTSGNSALALTASNGSVLGGGIVKGGVVTINSATGIDLVGPQNEISTLNASVTGSGNLNLINNKALSIASASTTGASAIDISTTAGGAFGIEVSGPITSGFAGSVALNAGSSGAITRVGASSVINTNNLNLQNTSSGPVGTNALPLLTRAVGGGTTDLSIGASGIGALGFYLDHTGRMTVNLASHYLVNSPFNLHTSDDLLIQGNLNVGNGALTLHAGGDLIGGNTSFLTGGAIDLQAGNDIAVGSVVSSTGSINMTAQSALTARGVSTSALNAGNITLTANTGNMILGADSAIDARSNGAGTNGAVTLTSGGAIQMLGGHTIKAGALDMKAANGIYGASTADAIAIRTDSVQAQNTSTGPIRLANASGALVVGGASNYGIDQQGAGDVSLMDASGTTTVVNRAVNAAGGNIVIQSTNGLALNAGVSASNGNIALSVAGGGNSELTISQLVNAGTGDVTLVSSGSVYGATGTNDITAGTLSISTNGTSTRGGGIGGIDGNGGLHVTVPRIAALNAVGAGIRIASLSDLIVGPATATAGSVVTTTGTLALSTATGHALTINGDVDAIAGIDLTAGSPGSSNVVDQVNFGRNVDSSGGNVVVNAHGVTGAHVPAGGNVTFNLYVAPVTPPPPVITPPPAPAPLVIAAQPQAPLSGAFAQVFNSTIAEINLASTSTKCGGDASVTTAGEGRKNEDQGAGSEVAAQQSTCN